MTTTQQTAAQQQANVPAAQPKKIDILKNMLNAPSVMQQFQNALSKSAPTFVASVIDLYNTDSKLQMCDPKAVVMEALKAAVLKLPINKALGYAYIIPFNNSKKDNHGNWTKVMEPTFQMGYKGYIQLAMRTGQYRTLNADSVFEGELRKVNKLTGEISFDGEKTSDKVLGYFCYFELLNGFSKTLYMTVNQMAAHAKRYSKGLKSDITIESLMNLSNLPMAADSKAVGWLGNFHGMALKTVIRLLLSKYGYLSIEMQQAFADDSDTGNEGDEHTDEKETINIESVSYEDVSHSDDNSEPDPGY
ncbi:MAG TPA: recombinase [Porphyromonadaceae bacterium]|nr:recombinase [Porphyromonadaceae bacterium]